MLNLTTLVAVSIAGTAATPFNAPVTLVHGVPTSGSTQVAIREIAPDFTLKLDPICKGCDSEKFIPSPVYTLTPERRALLNTIRYAEGTWNDGHESGYSILFGGRMVSSLNKHPNTVQFSGGYRSAAAGAYQFMPSTWKEAAQKLNLPNFLPPNQDQAALFLIERRGALKLADSGKLTPELVARLAPEWASFPTYSGRSYYGQPVRNFKDLRRFYEENLKENLKAT